MPKKYRFPFHYVYLSNIGIYPSLRERNISVWTNENFHHNEELVSDPLAVVICAAVLAKHTVFVDKYSNEQMNKRGYVVVL